MTDAKDLQLALNEAFVRLDAIVRAYRGVHVLGTIPERAVAYEINEAMKLLERLRDKAT